MPPSSTSVSDHPRASSKSAESQSSDDTSEIAGSRLAEAAKRLAEQGASLGERAKDTAHSVAGDMKDQAVHMLDNQVGVGASLLSQIAEAVRAAGESLDKDAPFLAGVVNRAAEQVDAAAEGLEDKSFAEIVGTVSEFTRRRPALVFGAAALCGFMLLRVARVDPTRARSSGNRRTADT